MHSGSRWSCQKDKKYVSKLVHGFYKKKCHPAILYFGVVSFVILLLNNNSPYIHCIPFNRNKYISIPIEISQNQ